MTKVSHEYLRAADFARSVEESLANLQVDYVDLLHVHWPTIDNIPLDGNDGRARESEARRQGAPHRRRELQHRARRGSDAAVPRAARRRCRPNTTPISTSRRCSRRAARWGIVFTAYCPLARGRVFNDPVLGEIARSKGKTIAQIALRWLMQQGNIAAIPRSANPKHMAESLQVFDFELTADEMSRISALKRPDGRIANPKGRAPPGTDDRRNVLSPSPGRTVLACGRIRRLEPYALTVPLMPYRGRASVIVLGRSRRAAASCTSGSTSNGVVNYSNTPPAKTRRRQSRDVVEDRPRSTRPRKR